MEIDRKVLGVAASAAIAVGNLLVPGAAATASEQANTQVARQAALTRAGGHIVTSAVSERPADQSETSATHAPSNNGGIFAPVSGREVIGCKAPVGATVENGSRSRRRVALTFDDGPSLKQTPSILAILNRQHVKATFFEEGRHVANRESLMNEILASGDEIGNHSYHHPTYPGYGELAETNRRIEEATGFRPCLFRPPYGLIDGSVASAARRTGLEMVLWDVDSLDDKHPGVSAIRSNVLSLAQPGSIILMHDGGHHPQTVRALPGIIRGLRERGFGFTTVTQLLGGRFLYR